MYELNGPEALSDQELASRISKVAGRPIRYFELSLDQLLKGMVASGMPEARARPVVELYEYYLAGRGEGSDKVLRDLLGRKPRTIDAAGVTPVNQIEAEEFALAQRFAGDFLGGVRKAFFGIGRW